MKPGDAFKAYLVFETEKEEVGESPLVADVVYLGVREEFHARYGDDAGLDDFATHVFGSSDEMFATAFAEKFGEHYVRGWHKAAGDHPDVWRESAYGGYRATYVLVLGKFR